ncbi:uncharacterized protein PAC_11164 [Phialocephala subalpina]|uniref:Terpene synthase n=1 Tax=Phialocephala subalpina TaxID=576137 RepID=A0A1L7X8C5_9HELO|nr:uncharacterized protein PAC_11164 [Phialocephala subalpina]
MAGQSSAAAESTGSGPAKNVNTNRSKISFGTPKWEEVVPMLDTANLSGLKTAGHAATSEEASPMTNTVNIAPGNTLHGTSETGWEASKQETINIVDGKTPQVESKPGDTRPRAETVNIEKMETPDGAVFKIEIPRGMKMIRIPDCVMSFMSIAPTIHPLYAEVKAETEAWLCKELGADDKLSKRITKTDWSYFASASAPLASKEDLKILCDWGNWVFPFDDPLDNGHLKDDPVKAKEMVDGTLAAMRGKVPETFAIAMVHNDIWERILSVISSIPNMQDRYAAAMEGYVAGALRHVQDFAEAKIPDLEDFIKVRSASAGVRPIIPMVELLHHIQVPDAVYSHPCLEKFRQTVVDMVILNDVLSYQKEENEGVPHNLITVLRHTGMSTQEAFDTVGGMLQKAYREWYIAQADLPLWGEKIDADVQKFIEGCRNIMLANLNWHFKCDRYLPSIKEVVRKCRVIVVKDQ